ncbi:MAG: hypothetical protein IJ733_17375 [Lachnospiraceae bacterium]|nr:hypothetical protein [Lachnospiraceae bacterium]
MIIAGIILLIIGILMIFDPGFYYEVTEGWKSSSMGEPSTFFVVSTRIGGVIFSVVGLAGIIGFFMSL